MQPFSYWPGINLESPIRAPTHCMEDMRTHPAPGAKAHRGNLERAHLLHVSRAIQRPLQQPPLLLFEATPEQGKILEDGAIFDCFKKRTCWGLHATPGQAMAGSLKPRAEGTAIALPLPLKGAGWRPHLRRSTGRR
jgi:hypothetical protein